MEELKGDYKVATSKLYELERLRRSKKIDFDSEIVKAKIAVLRLEIRMVNLEREENLASHLRMCSIPSKVHSYGKFHLMKPGECDCVHIEYSSTGTDMLLNYDMTIIYTEIDARYDHRIKMLQDEIDRLEVK